MNSVKPSAAQPEELLACKSPLGAIRLEHAAGRIRAIHEQPELEQGEAGREQQLELLLPGMLDLQVNGFAGVDVMNCDIDEFWDMARSLARTGVTSFLPTLISHPLETLIQRLEALAAQLDKGPSDAARPLGFHLEGPFLATSKRGAHPASDLLLPDVEILERLLDAADGQLRLVTLAAEVPGALDLIDRCVERDVRVSLGHSNATLAEAQRAVEHGATLCTHFGNAMSPLHHREPGLPGAVLVDERLKLCVIPDGIHVHDAILELAFRCKGDRGVVLVSDAMAAASLQDGDYELAGQRVHVREGVCRNDAGTLAGSALRLDEGLARWARVTGCSAAGLARVTSKNAADMLGIEELGVLREAARADLIALRRSDENLPGHGTWKLERVWLGGRPIAVEASN